MKTIHIEGGDAPDYAVSVYRIYPYKEFVSKKVDVDEVGTVVSLENYYNTVLIINDGPNSVYIAYNREATTSDFELKPGEYIEENIEVNQIGLITNSGESATVRILAFR